MIDQIPLPIVLDTPTVRSILQCRCNQILLPVKFPVHILKHQDQLVGASPDITLDDEDFDPLWCWFEFRESDSVERLISVPFPYLVGDYLFVRETWNYAYSDTSTLPSNYLFPKYQYRASDLDPEYNMRSIPKSLKMRWKAATCMPFDAARLFLHVSSIHACRFQSLDTPEFLQKQGYPSLTFEEFSSKVWDRKFDRTSREYLGSQSNPYVWRIQFTLCDYATSDELVVNKNIY